MWTVPDPVPTPAEALDGSLGFVGGPASVSGLVGEDVQDNQPVSNYPPLLAPSAKRGALAQGSGKFEAIHLEVLLLIDVQRYKRDSGCFW